VLTQIVHKTEAPLNWRDKIVCSPELLRFRGAFEELSDLFLGLLMLISFAGMFLSIVLIVTGRFGSGAWAQLHFPRDHKAPIVSSHFHLVPSTSRGQLHTGADRQYVLDLLD
jgi:hypothetical protein